jgi:hypothetical protein
MPNFFDLIFKSNSEPNFVKGCPHCAGKQEIVFVWSRSLFKQSIQKIQEIRYSEFIYQCTECDTHWLLQGDYMRKIIDLALVKRWDEKFHQCPESFLEVLLQIGKTNFLTFPFAGKLKTGEFLAACELHFIEEAPVWLDDSRKIIFIDDFESIQHSEFALPQKIREKTAEAWEIRMGFAPTAVKATNGTTYLLHGIKNFFCQDNLKGSELQNIVTEFEEATAKEAHYEGPETVIVVADLEPKLLIW